MNDTVQRSDALDKKLEGDEVIEGLVKRGQINQRLIRVLGVLVSFNLILLMAVGYLAWQASSLATEADSLQRRTHDTCIASNDARAGQIALWDYILDLTGQNPNQTPQQKDQVAKFRVYVQNLFAPRKC